MKLLLTLATMALAQEEPDAKKFSGISQFAYSQVTTSYELSVFNKMIQNYGCHCFLQSERLAGGKGSPVDEMDDLCRKLSRCHSCVRQDYDYIDTHWGKYKYDISTGTIDCSANTDEGKLNHCLCDKEFAEGLGAIWDDSSYNIYYWKNKNNIAPTFDPESTCVAKEGPGTTDACCGTFPERRPYASNMFDCCPDGKVKSIGGC